MKRLVSTYSSQLILLFLFVSCQPDVAIKYYPTGKLESRVPLDQNGLYHGLSIDYYQNGQVSAKIPFQHGVLTGRIELFYPSGAQLAIKNWKANRPNGVVKHFYSTGQLKSVYRQYGPRKIGLSHRYTSEGILQERVLFSQTGRILDFDKFDRAGRRDKAFTRPLVVAPSDTIRMGEPFLFTVVLANRETNAVTIKFSRMEARVDSIQERNGTWKYRVATPHEGINFIRGKAYNHRLSGDTLHTWWYELNHRFYVQPSGPSSGR